MNKILNYLKSYILRISLGLAVKSLSSFAELFIPWILAYIIDDVIPDADKNGSTPIFIYGGVMLLLSAIAVIGNICANRMASAVARDTTRRVRHDLFEKTMYLSAADVDSFEISSLISRMTSDTYILHQTVGMIQRIGVRAPILIIGGIAATLMLDPMLSLVMVCSLPFVSAVIYFFSRRGMLLYSTVQNSADNMIRVVRENITGVRVIRAMAKDSYERRRFDVVNTELTADEKKAGTTMAAINPLVTLIFNSGLAAVILAGAFRVNAGLSEVGKIIAFMTYFTIILNALVAMSKIFTMVSRALASASRISEVLDSPDTLGIVYGESACGKQKRAEYCEDVPCIEFRHVSFSYPFGKFRLSDISFTLMRGETLGIIGATGSGKSTLVSLMLRFCDPDEGEIYIDGKNIRDYTAGELRTKFGTVFQNDILFNSTVGKNIRLGRDIDDIYEALDASQASDFVSATGGEDAAVSIKGSNFSGGQRQRILIARALAGSPEILILDDSASALDYKTDADLRNALGKKYPDTTKIIVAQRVCTISHADHILVLNNGGIAGYGTGDELMKSCAEYRETALSQEGGSFVE